MNSNQLVLWSLLLGASAYPAFKYLIKPLFLYLRREVCRSIVEHSGMEASINRSVESFGNTMSSNLKEVDEVVWEIIKHLELNLKEGTKIEIKDKIYVLNGDKDINGKTKFVFVGDTHIITKRNLFGSKYHNSIGLRQDGYSMDEKK